MVILITRSLTDVNEALYGLKNVKALSNLQELQDLLKKSPLELTSLITTSDIFIENIKDNASLYMDIIEDKFLKVNQLLHLVSDMASPEVSYLKFRAEDRITFKQMLITQDTLIDVLQGKVSMDNAEVESFRVFMLTQEEAVARAEAEKAKANSNIKVPTDTDILQGAELPDSLASISKNLYTKGLDTTVHNLIYTDNTRTTALQFAVVHAQTLARKGKTVVIEDDVKYMPIAHYMSKLLSDKSEYEITDLLANTSVTLNKIVNDKNNLILLKSSKILDLNSEFYKSMSCKLLEKYVDTVVVTSSVQEPAKGKPILVMTTDLIQILTDVSKIPLTHNDLTVLCINTSSITEAQLLTREDVTSILSMLTGVDLNVNCYMLQSLKGGNNELYML